MSYSVRDNLGGKRIQVTYGAAKLPLPAQSGRRRKSRVIRDHLAHNRSRYALVVRSGEDLEYWWVAESAGVSFAAAIEAWLLEGSGPSGRSEAEEGNSGPDATGEFMVLIPMDARVYIAEVGGGLVRNERILPPERADEPVAEAVRDGTVVYAFSPPGPGGSDGSGNVAEGIRRHVELDELPFDPAGYRFRPAWRIFAGHGLLHPTHALAGLLLAAVVGLAALSGPAVQLLGRWWPKEVPVQIAAETPPVEVIPRVPHTAAADLEQLARFLVLGESLYGDGLKEFRMDRSGAVYSGNALDANGKSVWPGRVADLFFVSGSEWQMDSSGWTVRVSRAEDPGTDRSPAIGYEETLRSMMTTPMPVRFRLETGPEKLPPQHDQGKNTVTRPLNRTTWSANVDAAIVGTLLDQATVFGHHERATGIPAALDHATCSFQGWMVRSCSLHIEINSL